MMRPETFECPWCGPNGVPVDFSLPEEDRLCDRCGGDCYCPERPPVESPYVAEIRGLLRDHVRDFERRWPGMDFGRAHYGNMLLGALKAWGCDPKEELQRAVDARKG